jgi:ketosteroid isomerase-like protein
VIEALEDWSESWQRWDIELVEAIDAGGDHVVLVQRTRGKARGSGLEVEQQYYAVCRVRDGRVARMEQIADREAALAQAGLGEVGESAATGSG